jgi:hypothetical protein
VIESALGLLMTACIVLAFTRPHTLVAVPFLVLFAIGYLCIGLPSLRSLLPHAAQRPRSPALAPATIEVSAKVQEPVRRALVEQT